jgi:hypothetical protein
MTIEQATPTDGYLGVSTFDRSRGNAGNTASSYDDVFVDRPESHVAPSPGNVLRFPESNPPLLAQKRSATTLFARALTRTRTQVLQGWKLAAPSVYGGGLFGLAAIAASAAAAFSLGNMWAAVIASLFVATTTGLLALVVLARDHE